MFDKKKRTQECIDYFRNSPGLHRLMKEIKNKYRSLGNLGGNIRLPNLQKEEKMALSGLLRMDFSSVSQADIPVRAVLEALECTKFQGLDFLSVLKGFWGGEFLTKKEEVQKKQQTRTDYFFQLQKNMPTKAAEWLKSILHKKNNAYRTLIYRYGQDPELLERDLLAVGEAVEKLPIYFEAKIQLPIFSAQITANPHYFDRDSEAGQLLIYALCYLFDGKKPANSFEEAELLYKAGLYSTEISNYAVCKGLLGYTKCPETNVVRNDSESIEPLLGGKNVFEVHQGWRGFYEKNESLQVSLENLSFLDKIESPSGIVFVVENPAVFSALAAEAKRQYNQPLPIVCSNGQVNLATLILLNLLVDGGAILYYSGDFDPEGLLIANRLKERFGNALHLWRYTIDDYRRALSEESLTKRRIKKTEKLTDEVLKEVGLAMDEKGYAGYQEALLDKLWFDIKSLNIFAEERMNPAGK